MSFLQNHPFAVDAFFERSLVLTYAAPKDLLQKLLPPCLTVDTHADQWGFVAVAMVQTKHLRPAGFPRFLGNDFFLIGYRIFVRYNTSWGKRLRGLYILKSETDKSRMAFWGNVFTHYQYTTTDVHIDDKQDRFSVVSNQSPLQVTITTNNTNTPLPQSSPFANWKEARRFAGPLPFTFTYQPQTNKVLIIEGVRESWTPEPVQVQKAEVGFINQLKLPGCVLANAFMVKNIPYHWKKGKTDLWMP